MKKSSQRKVKTVQTGFGFDSHLYSRRGELVLGGRLFPGIPALRGHSDGDAVLHALIDALLGSVAGGDIGQMFPDSEPSIRGLSSRFMLKEALKKVRQKGFRPVHVDLTVLADRPKIAPVQWEVRTTIAKLLSLPVGNISLKAKTPEGLRLFKSPGGVAAWAVVTVQRDAQ